MFAKYKVTVDIWFHQDSDPGAGPEPYGWIKCFQVENPSIESTIWEKPRTNETFTHKRVQFDYFKNGEIDFLSFYGDVKDWDNNADDILAYPQNKVAGKPGELIRLRGDYHDSYVDIKYSVEKINSTRNSDTQDMQNFCSFVETLERKIIFLQEMIKNLK
ncbi:hypothetical protein [Bacillus cereus]|uniref:hypothetical protein n=1 Tax=Bacillus cereus TaxID=1396 RepID=UPI001E36D3A2|nr:hypothetical protein [Bacillus cereus]MCD2338396.1 hypothetical protein [Bacillus cereus]